MPTYLINVMNGVNEVLKLGRGGRLVVFAGIPWNRWLALVVSFTPHGDQVSRVVSGFGRWRQLEVALSLTRLVVSL